MAIERTFLGWDKACLPRCADELLARSRVDGEFDLSRTVVVLPGARAGRRLLELLVAGADARGGVLLPPEIVTTGAVAERLYRPRRPFAERVARTMAWVQALRDSHGDALPALTHAPPDPDDHEGWAHLAQIVDALYVELSGEQLGFEDVAARGEQLETFGDGDRWRALVLVRDRFLARLTAAGLDDPHAARRDALARGEASSDRTFVLAACADLPGIVRALLAASNVSARALVFAPDEMRDRFEDDGTLAVRPWRDAHVEIDDARIHMVDGPSEEADAVLAQLVALDGRFRADDIVVGVTDDAVTAQVVQRLARVGIGFHVARGTPVERAAAVQLLSTLRAFTVRERFDAFAALARHPDVEPWLARDAYGRPTCPPSTPTVPDALDAFATDHLPSLFRAPFVTDGTTAPTVARIHERWTTLAAELHMPPRRLSAWAEPVQAFLLRLYAEREFDRSRPEDRAALEVFGHIADALSAIHRLPESLAQVVPLHVALHAIVDEVRGAAVPPAAGDAAVEILGWLELALDDAPVLVATSLNEGRVPESLNADAFLPNTLRRHLGILDNDRRYARDAYALASMVASKEELHLVAARWSGQRDPLAPSRLLLAAPPETIARRLKRFYSDETRDEPTCTPWQLRGGVANSQLPVPTPDADARWDITRALRVTGFRSYLTCPYRFWLSVGLRLEAVDDDAHEMSPAIFGTLAHKVLESLADRAIASESRADRVREFLREQLDTRARARFGARPQPAVRIQLEQLSARIEAFARWQASHAADGWRVERVEFDILSPAVGLDVGAGRLALSGRIDRVDVNDRTGERWIFDYKTTASANTPDAAHRTKGAWTDLQLPLYLHFAAAAGLQNVTGGSFLNLPRDFDEVGEAPARWTAEDIADAVVEAHRIGEAVTQGRFWPPSDRVRPEHDGFADVLQRGALRADTDENGEAMGSDE